MKKLISIDINSFYKDFREIYTKEILDITKTFKIQTKLNDEIFLKNLTDREFFENYFIFKIKFPDLKPRRVIITDECKKSKFFQKNIKYIEKIKKIFENGEDFYSYLSKGLLNYEKDNKNIENNSNIKIDFDVMLFSTRIHHLHLEDKIEKDGFIKRSSKLLFCIIFEDEVYFLNIYEHLNGTDEWCKTMENELIEIIKNNNFLKKHYAQFFLEDMLVIQENGFTSKEKYILSKNGITNLFYTLNGNPFIPYFFGTATDSSFNYAINNTDNFYNIINNIKNYLNNNSKLIYDCSRIKTKNNKFYTNFTLTIKKENEWFYIVDKYKKDLGIIFKFKFEYDIYKNLVSYSYQTIEIQK